MCGRRSRGGKTRRPSGVIVDDEAILKDGGATFSHTVNGNIGNFSDLTADTISECTVTAGVTINGVNLKDADVFASRLRADGIDTDEINEQTVGVGVTIEGCSSRTVVSPSSMDA